LSRTQYAAELARSNRVDEALAVLEPVLGDRCERAWTTAISTAASSGRWPVVRQLGQRAGQRRLEALPAAAGQVAWALALSGEWVAARAAGSSAAKRLPGGHGAAVVAAAAWRGGDRLEWTASGDAAPDRVKLQTWAVRLLSMAGEKAAVAGLEADGVHPNARVGPLDEGNVGEIAVGALDR
jgi:hypothetical protein